MDWITVIWSMVASVCLTFALIYLLVWAKSVGQVAYLLFSITALSAAAIAICELAILRSQTVASAVQWVRWIHIPVFILIASLVGFVRMYLGAGRGWLAWMVIGSRVLILVLNFSAEVNLNFSQVTGIHQVPIIGGGVISVLETVTSPLNALGPASLLLFLAFLIDAGISAWRRGKRRSALLICGSTAFCVTAAGVHVSLIHAGVIESPYLISFAYLAIVVAMGFELSSDILRSAHLARELLESEQRLDLAAEAADLGLWVWDVPRDDIWFNERGRALFGMEPHEAVDLDRFLRVLHPEDRDPVRGAVLAALEGRGVYEAEFRIIRPDQTVRWIAARGRVQFNGGGGPSRLRGVSIDITRRKLAEELAHLIVEAAPNGMVMVDSGGRIVTVNNQVRSIFGYEASELIGQTLESLLPEPVRAGQLDVQSIRELRNGFRSMGPARELFGRRKDGSEVPVEISLTSVATREGTLVLVHIVDATERKRSELELTRRRNELAHLSRVTMLGELSGSLAHELNQPLAAILSNAQAALRFLDRTEVDLAEVREIIDDIVDQDRRAGELIRRLRLLFNKGEVQKRPLDLNEVVQEVMTLMRNDLINHEVSARLELVENLPPICGDRVQLLQVVLNLVMNACDAMADVPLGFRNLLVRSECGPDSAVNISVVDCGHGMKTDHLRQLFEPFFTTKSQGMGMGLAICRTIIEAHGGRLCAENNPTSGATFRFALPPLNGVPIP